MIWPPKWPGHCTPCAHGDRLAVGHFSTPSLRKAPLASDTAALSIIDARAPLAAGIDPARADHQPVYRFIFETQDNRLVLVLSTWH